MAAGESMSPDDYATALVALNQVLGGLSTEKLAVYGLQHTQFPFTALLAGYTMGVGGTWATPARPVRVEAATATSGSFRQPMDVITFSEYAAILDPMGTSAILPKKLAADNAYPLLNIRAWPVPAGGGMAEVHYWQAITNYVATTDNVDLPPGHERMLKFLLALDLATSYGVPASIVQGLVSQAQDAKGDVLRLNESIVGPPAQPSEPGNPPQGPPAAPVS
jgi:hypothetical protein